MANTFKLPTDQGDLAPYDFQVELDGVVYTVGLRFLERTQRWLYDLSTADGTVLLQGQPVLNAYPLLQRFQDGKLPPGDLRAVATSEPAREANADELGTRVLLLYNAVQ